MHFWAHDILDVRSHTFFFYPHLFFSLPSSLYLLLLSALKRHNMSSDAEDKHDQLEEQPSESAERAVGKLPRLTR
jgi:hypothetical protein